MNVEIKKKIRELGPWRHNIDLRGFQTKKISPLRRDLPPHGPPMDHPKARWKVIRRFLPEEDATCVDLGCNAGGISFKLEKLGYEVTGVEIGDRQYKQAIFAKRVLDSDVDFIQEDVIEFLENSPTFDYSVALGLIYHLRNPEKFIELLNEKTEKRFVIESSFYDDVNGREWIEENETWHFSTDWLKKKIIEKTEISEVFTAKRGEKGLPVRGFRFLIAGKF